MKMTLAEDLSYEIAAEIDHGECFFEEEMLYQIVGKIEKLKRLVFEGYKDNQEAK